MTSEQMKPLTLGPQLIDAFSQFGADCGVFRKMNIYFSHLARTAMGEGVSMQHQKPEGYSDGPYPFLKSDSICNGVHS